LITPIAVNTILILDEKEDIPIIIAALIKENTIESYRIIVLES
jgi:precorrin-6B methylase 1